MTEWIAAAGALAAFGIAATMILSFVAAKRRSTERSMDAYRELEKQVEAGRKVGAAEGGKWVNERGNNIRLEG